MLSFALAFVFASLGIFGHAPAFVSASPPTFFCFVPIFFCFALAFFGASPVNP